MIKQLVFVLFCITLVSCSTIILPSKKRVSIDELNTCKTRTCILSKGITPVEMEKDKQGRIISEVYVVRQPRKASSKVLTDGVLDVATIGIWEMAGTPIDGSLKCKNEYAIKITYSDGERIKQVELA